MQGTNGFLRFLTTVFTVLFFVPSAYGATIIDVMVVYDSTGATWVRSTSCGGLTTCAKNVVARMNEATANSNLALKFRMVHAAEVGYTHSGNLQTDADNLYNGTGNLSVVHQWRDTYGADLVVMLVDTGTLNGTLGKGNLLTSHDGQPDRAFSVCAIESVNISHTMTHEIGHNLGAGHSIHQTVERGPQLDSYSAGWYFDGTSATKYHTIMAYTEDGYGNTYIEAPLFSTPLMSYAGGVAGDAVEGDNSRTIRDTMNVVAAYRFTSASSNWQQTGLGGYNVQSVAVFPGDGQIVYAGTDSGGVFKTTDGGTSWTAINAGLTNSDVRCLAIDPANSQVVYAGTWGGGVFKTTDGGTSWTAVNTGLLKNYQIRSFAIDPTNNQIVYMKTNWEDEVFKTINGGVSWTLINTGLTNNGVFSLAIDPTDNQVVYAGCGWYSKVYKTINGGASWTLMSTGLYDEGNYVASFAIDPTNSQVVYAGTWGGGIFKTNNGGTSWMKVHYSSPYEVRSIAIDPANSRVVYATGGQGGAVYKTTDGGLSWTFLGLSNISVYSLSVDPANSQVVYAGTYSGGVYKTKPNPVPLYGDVAPVDGDVDGSDLAVWIAAGAPVGMDVPAFAASFGRTTGQ